MPSSTQSPSAAPPSYSSAGNNNNPGSRNVSRNMSPGWVVFEFSCVPKRSPRRIFWNPLKPFWRARMEVWANNPAQLIQDGFNWSAANVVPEKGYLVLDDRALPKKYGCKSPFWRSTRVYRLKDMGPDGAWEADLSVFTQWGCDVGDFNIRMITMETTTSARAYNGKKLIYAACKPNLCINTINDNTQLNGWCLPTRELPQAVKGGRIGPDDGRRRNRAGFVLPAALIRIGTFAKTNAKMFV